VDLAVFFPAAFEKIASNLEHYVETLARDGQLDIYDLPKNAASPRPESGSKM
jgi:hypothetical protein